MEVLFLMADGFEETEFVTPFDYWQRGGVEVTLASISNSLEVTGAHGLRIQADVLLQDLDISDFEAVCLPGGGLGVKNLSESDAVEKTVCAFNAAGKFVFAICAAPIVLSKAGLLKDRKATCFPGCEVNMDCKEFSVERVVTDGNITTSRGAGTAEEFAFACLALMCGKDESEKIRKQVVAR